MWESMNQIWKYSGSVMRKNKGKKKEICWKKIILRWEYDSSRFKIAFYFLNFILFYFNLIFTFNIYLNLNFIYFCF